MDGTLLKGRTILKAAEEHGCGDQVTQILESSKIPYKKTKDIAKLLACMTPQKFLEIFRKIPLQPHATAVIQELKKRGIKTAVVTDSYLLAAQDLQTRLGIDYAYANNLIIKEGHITGQIRMHNTCTSKRFPGCRQHSICKGDILAELATLLGIKPGEILAVGDSDVDKCMLQRAGLGIAFKAPETVQKVADISTEDLRIILDHV